MQVGKHRGGTTSHRGQLDSIERCYNDPHVAITPWRSTHHTVWYSHAHDCVRRGPGWEHVMRLMRVSGSAERFDMASSNSFSAGSNCPFAMCARAMPFSGTREPEKGAAQAEGSQPLQGMHASFGNAYQLGFMFLAQRVCSSSESTKHSEFWTLSVGFPILPTKFHFVVHKPVVRGKRRAVCSYIFCS